MLTLTNLAALLLCVTVIVTASADTFELNAGFDDLVAQLLNLFRVPGLSLAVIKDGKITSKGYGYASFPNTPATPDTLWYTASTTKAFVAAAAGLLVEDDRYPQFGWSTPVSDLMPGDFALTEDYQTTHTTLEDALSHRSGLPRHDVSYGWDNATTLDAVKRMRYLPLTAEPRTRWQYSNLMYGTVGALLEQNVGLRVGDILAEWIWKPLGMDSTTFDTDKAIASGNLATGYHWSVEEGYYVPEPLFDVIPIAGAGATISSMNDYALWAKTLLATANGELNDTNPISNKLLNQLWTPRSIVNLGMVETNDPFPIAYALGWMTLRIGEHVVITHSGGVPGFGTQVFLVPALRLGFVSAGNNMNGAAGVGATLFLSLLKKKKLELASMEDADFEQMLGQLPPISAIAPEKRQISEDTAASQGQVLPLPGCPKSYIGLYDHPAYGTYNVSLLASDHKLALSGASPVQAPLNTAESVRFLVQPSERTIPSAFILRHTTNAFFSADFYWVHGPTPGNDRVTCERRQKSVKMSQRSLECKDEAVWEKLANDRAVFEFGPDGKVEKLGMELEPEQVRFAMESGDWRKGMIWFTKRL
ncbi:putative beta-lactamase/transpeptidase [Septoria linicola]|nr:putative beta-lactamase/transpeptidase [Septoria linicola]